MSKISIRLLDDREMRAVWDERNAGWWFSVLDIIGVLRNEDDPEKNRNYWKYLKAKLRREGNQPGSVTTRFNLSRDGKRRLANVLDGEGVRELAKQFPGRQANRFLQWFTYGEESIDGLSKAKAYSLFDSSLLESIEVGTVNGFQ